MTASSINRRGLLGAALLTPLAAAAAALPASPVGTAEWDHALARYRDTCVKHDAAARAFSRCEERYFAARRNEPEKPELAPLDTSVSIADLCAGINTEWTEKWAAHEQAHKAWQEQDAALHEHLTGAAERVSQRACDARTAALGALMALPAPTLARAIQKMDLLLSEFGDLDGERTTAVLADLRPLNGEAA